MKLTGNRILIRNITLKDVDDYYEYAKSPNIGPNAGWKPVPSRRVAERVVAGFIARRDTFAIEERSYKKMIGTISIYPDSLRKNKLAVSVGFSINEDFQNMGYATEALKLIIHYIFNYMNMDIIEIGHHVDNVKSKRVIEKCGFHYDGRLNKYKMLYDGRYVDACFYSLTKEDYDGGKK